MQKKIGVLVGSLREGSYNRAVADCVCGMLPEGFAAEVLDIGALPLYNEDLDREGALPAAWADFRARLAGQDAFLFVTPEYNRSLPAALKNAIDVGSRPYGASLWAGKPGAVLSVSTGGIGGFGANHALRQCLVFLDVYTMPQPEAYIGHAADLISSDGRVGGEGTRGFLQAFADAFAAWVERFEKVDAGEQAPERDDAPDWQEETICSAEFSAGCMDTQNSEI